jgi:hypothetical protein
MSKEDTSSDTVLGPLELGPPDDSKFADANIVDWDAPDDAANPRNWPSRKRWAHVVLISILALIT